MNPLGTMSRPVVVGALLGLTLAGPPLAAQVDVRVAVGTIREDRNRYGTQDPSGSITIFPKLEGAGLDSAKAFRMTVTSAHVDAGTPLELKSDEPKWADSTNDPTLWIKLGSPAREASTVTVAGTLEVYVPSLDPAAEVKVENFWSKTGKPLVSRPLQDAQVDLAIFTREEVSANTVAFLGWADQAWKVQGVRVIRADGSEIPASSRGRSSDGEKVQTELSFSEPVPDDAGIVFTLMTEKSVASLPFELKDIPLP